MADLLDSRIGVNPPQLVRINGYLMDLALNEGHSFPGEVTKYPVESGPDTSDHIRDLPIEITLECVVSDTPIGDVATDESRRVDDATGETPLPSVDALAKLREFKAARRPVTLETSLGKFSSMAFESLDVPRDKDKNNALFFTAKFVEFRTTTNERTKIRVKVPMAGAGGKSAVKAVAGKVIVVDTTVEWQHDIATGQFVGVVSTVEIHYNRPAGMTKSEALALGAVAPESSLIEYFDAGSPTPITGDRRRRLVADLAKQAEQTNPNFDVGLGPNAQLRKDRNLPPGVSLQRFQREPEPTFGVTQKDIDSLQSRFGKSVAPTLPAAPGS